MLLQGAFRCLHQLRIILTGKATKPFLLFQGSRAGFFSDLFTSRFREAGLRIPFDRPFDFTQGHEQRRMAQGCGFPHTQVAKRTAPSRQSLQKRFHGLASAAPAFLGIIEENRPTVTSKKATVFLMQRSARSNRRGLFSPVDVSSSYCVSGIQD
jgi:hypothetical protein